MTVTSFLELLIPTIAILSVIACGVEIWLAWRDAKRMQRRIDELEQAYDLMGRGKESGRTRRPK